jgi:tripartite-type tricarboxylate transporter receptor subunit TctC
MKTMKVWGVSAATRLAATAAVMWGGSAVAQEKFPSRPITLIVPFAAGGPVDIHMRPLADQMSKVFGVPVVVDVKPGAGGTLGPATMAATAKPDGYTISELPSGIYSVPVMQKVSFDPAKDFTYIIHLSGYRFVVIAPTESKWKTWKELVADVKANPGKITYASTGTGGALHLGMEAIAQVLDMKLVHLPTKGASEQVATYLGGHVQFIPTGGLAVAQVESGKSRPLLVWTETPLRSYPGAPTAKDEGIKTQLSLTFPYGIGGPKGMKPEIVKALHDGIKTAMETPEVKKVVENLEQDNIYKNSADYTKFAQEQIAATKTALEGMGLAAK